MKRVEEKEGKKKPPRNETKKKEEGEREKGKGKRERNVQGEHRGVVLRYKKKQE